MGKARARNDDSLWDRMANAYAVDAIDDVEAKSSADVARAPFAPHLLFVVEQRTAVAESPRARFGRCDPGRLYNWHATAGRC